MIKVFISQPMNGLSDEAIKETRKEAMDILDQYYGKGEYSVIDSFIHKNIPKVLKNPGVYYLGRSICKMQEANLVVMMDGWDTARGCQIERQIADAYDILVLTESELRAQLMHRSAHETFDILTAAKKHTNLKKIKEKVEEAHNKLNQYFAN